MSRCSCGFSTICKDEFCAHLADTWNDVRNVHDLK
jgi:hypothetical protein